MLHSPAWDAGAAGTLKHFCYLEGFSSFKWKPRSRPLLLSPVILEHGITDNNFPLIFLEAGVEVEGDVIPSLEIHRKPAKTRTDLLLFLHKPWALLQGLPKPAARGQKKTPTHRPCWAMTEHLHVYIVEYLIFTVSRCYSGI